MTLAYTCFKRHHAIFHSLPTTKEILFSLDNWITESCTYASTRKLFEKKNHVPLRCCLSTKSPGRLRLRKKVRLKALALRGFDVCAKGRGRLDLKCVTEETFFLVLKSFRKMAVGVLQGGAKGTHFSWLRRRCFCMF